MQKTTQMTYTGYTDASFTEMVGKPYICTINPDSSVLSDTLQFELILEDCECITTSHIAIEKAVAALKSSTYRYNGIMQTPNYVMIEWGDVFTFKGTVSSFTVSYTSLKPDGEALRAKIALTFAAVRSRVLFPN